MFEFLNWLLVESLLSSMSLQWRTVSWLVNCSVRYFWDMKTCVLLWFKSDKMFSSATWSGCSRDWEDVLSFNFISPCNRLKWDELFQVFVKWNSETWTFKRVLWTWTMWMFFFNLWRMSLCWVIQRLVKWDCTILWSHCLLLKVIIRIFKSETFKR
jgi:hypothetical protein